MSAGDPRPSACQAARQALLGALDPTGHPVAQSPSFHCAACEAWFQRAQVHGRALSSMPRLAAEHGSLDGRVVAELNAGCRQERASAALRSLARRTAPSELDIRAADLFGRMDRSAPSELDGRVAGELRGVPNERVQRQLAALERLSPPAELDARVATILARPVRSMVRAPGRWLALAASLLAVIGVASLAWQGGMGGGRPYEFKVVRSDSTDSLDPLSRSLLSGASGGFFDLPESTTRIDDGRGQR